MKEDIFLFNAVMILSVLIFYKILRLKSKKNLTKYLFIEFWLCCLSYSYLFIQKYPNNLENFNLSLIITGFLSGLFLTTTYLIRKD